MQKAVLPWWSCKQKHAWGYIGDLDTSQCWLMLLSLLRVMRVLLLDEGSRG